MKLGWSLFFRLMALSTVATILVSHLGFVWWGFEVFSHLSPWIGLMAGAVVGVLALARRVRLAGLVVACGLTIWIPWLKVAPWSDFFTSPEKVTSAQEPSLGLVFANINLHNTQLEKVVAWVDQTQPDYVFLAEVSVKNYGQLQDLLAAEYPFSHHQPGRGVFGMAVFSRDSLVDAVTTHDFALAGLPSLEVSAQLADQPVSLISTHPYPPVTQEFTQRRNQQLLGLAAYLGQIKTSKVLVGDFNTSSFGWTFHALLSEGQMVDSRVSRGWQGSWPSQNPSWLQITIDHALISSDLAVVERQVGPDIGSDHLPLYLEVVPVSD